ncbi:MAG: hypothetical protein R2788_21690 [Saprospiraceae bacterium]
MKNGPTGWAMPFRGCCLSCSLSAFGFSSSIGCVCGAGGMNPFDFGKSATAYKKENGQAAFDDIAGLEEAKVGSP